MKEHATHLFRVAWPVVMVAGGLIVWGARLELQVGQKADRQDVLGIEARVMTELRDVSETTERMERMMTRIICSQNPNDMSCP